MTIWLCLYRLVCIICPQPLSSDVPAHPLWHHWKLYYQGLPFLINYFMSNYYVVKCQGICQKKSFLVSR